MCRDSEYSTPLAMQLIIGMGIFLPTRHVIVTIVIKQCHVAAALCSGLSIESCSAQITAILFLETGARSANLGYKNQFELTLF
jgi:hypothetical protein